MKNTKHLLICLVIALLAVLMISCDDHKKSTDLNLMNYDFSSMPAINLNSPTNVEETVISVLIGNYLVGEIPVYGSQKYFSNIKKETTTWVVNDEQINGTFTGTYEDDAYVLSFEGKISNTDYNFSVEYDSLVETASETDLIAAFGQDYVSSTDYEIFDSFTNLIFNEAGCEKQTINALNGSYNVEKVENCVEVSFGDNVTSETNENLGAITILSSTNMTVNYTVDNSNSSKALPISCDCSSLGNSNFKSTVNAEYTVDGSDEVHSLNFTFVYNFNIFMCGTSCMPNVMIGILDYDGKQYSIGISVLGNSCPV